MLTLPPLWMVYVASAALSTVVWMVLVNPEGVYLQTHLRNAGNAWAFRLMVGAAGPLTLPVGLVVLIALQFNVEVRRRKLKRELDQQEQIERLYDRKLRRLEVDFEEDV